MSIVDIVAIAWTLLALALVPMQLKTTAPYGRHARTDWGPSIGNQLGWCIMELVSLVVFAGLFLLGPNDKTEPMWVFFALWAAHYINRSLIFPWRTHTRGKSMPVAIVASAALFNIVNAGLNGGYLGSWGPVYPPEWISDPRFIGGLMVFALGAAINISSDNRLIGLRAKGGTDYTIPQGGLFRFVSCPNLMGEIIQWTGFAIMCWNLPALSFAVWTAANLIPRAVSHHKWYRAKFPDYPADRRAVIPGLI
ncbi:MAG: 3-oxo-5-alpha-steroid 4-dehydrogenase [Hyphomicrobiales bacterium]|nr:MAG: 3-oxo-5-alpha-steroid 4-dehydrogenase [Hyphomicrobiales bacterium]